MIPPPTSHQPPASSGVFFDYTDLFAFIGLCVPSLLIAALLVRGVAIFFHPPTPAMLLLILYSGLLKMIEVVFEGRLQHAIPSDRRATIGSVKGFAGEVGVTGLYLLFGPVAQAISYQAAFLACGAAGVAIGLGYLATARRPSSAR